MHGDGTYKFADGPCSWPEDLTVNDMGIRFGCFSSDQDVQISLGFQACLLWSLGLTFKS